MLDAHKSTLTREYVVENILEVFNRSTTVFHYPTSQPGFRSPITWRKPLERLAGGGLRGSAGVCGGRLGR